MRQVIDGKVYDSETSTMLMWTKKLDCIEPDGNTSDMHIYLYENVQEDCGFIYVLTHVYHRKKYKCSREIIEPLTKEEVNTLMEGKKVRDWDFNVGYDCTKYGSGVKHLWK